MDKEVHPFWFKVELSCLMWLQENPAVILADLGAIKAKHANLFFEMEEIAAAQRQSMGSVRRSINTIKELTQHLQPASDVEVTSPTKLTH